MMMIVATIVCHWGSQKR